MQTSSSFISNHRIARLSVWLTLWLGRFARVWMSVLPAREVRAWLAQCAQYIAMMLLVRALRRVDLPEPPPRRRAAPPRGFALRWREASVRRMIGGALRRALSGRNARRRNANDRLAALLRVLHEAERHVARLVKRLERRLTRLKRLLPIAPPAASGRDVAAPLLPACADTS